MPLVVPVPHLSLRLRLSLRQAVGSSRVASLVTGVVAVASQWMYMKPSTQSCALHQAGRPLTALGMENVKMG